MSILFIDKEIALQIHLDIITTSGGSHGLRDEGLLESALAKPENLYAYQEVTLFEMAAAYAEGIALNHAFIDGNKRTAFAVAGIFLSINGIGVKLDQEEIAEIMVHLATRKITRTDFANYLEKNATGE